VEIFNLQIHLEDLSVDSELFTTLIEFVNKPNSLLTVQIVCRDTKISFCSGTRPFIPIDRYTIFIEILFIFNKIRLNKLVIHDDLLISLWCFIPRCFDELKYYFKNNINSRIFQLNYYIPIDNTPKIPELIECLDLNSFVEKINLR